MSGGTKRPISLTKQTNMRCDKCGYTTFSPSSMWYHRKTHNGIKPYKCHYCSYSALVHSTLTTHMKRRHGYFPTNNRPGRKPNLQRGPSMGIKSDPPRMMSSDKKKKMTGINMNDNIYNSGDSSMPIISSVYTLPRDTTCEPTPVGIIDNMRVNTTSPTSTIAQINGIYTLPQTVHATSSSNTQSQLRQQPAPSCEAPTIVGLLNRVSADIGKLMKGEQNSITSHPVFSPHETFATPSPANSIMTTLSSPRHGEMTERDCLESRVQEQVESHHSSSESEVTQYPEQDNGLYALLRTNSHNTQQQQHRQSQESFDSIKPTEAKRPRSESVNSTETVTVHSDSLNQSETVRVQSEHVNQSDTGRVQGERVNQSECVIVQSGNSNLTQGVRFHGKPGAVSRNTQCKYPYRCNHCAIGFEDVMMYIIHMGCHNSTNAFQCNACGHVCDDKFDFASHLIIAGHGGSKT